MKRLLFILSLMLTRSVLMPSPACAEGNLAPQMNQSTGRCDHVISMMLKHGVNNRFDRSEASRLLQSTSTLLNGLPPSELGDLDLVQVSQLASAANCGPRIAVQLMNRSHRKVERFHVTAVAVLGHICPDSPSATFEVAELEAGAILEVQLQLPIEAFAMGNRNGTPLGFQTLVVAIDSFDALLESDESNNIRAWSASDLPVEQPVAVTQAVELLQANESNQATTVQPQANREVESPVERPDLEQPTPDSLRAAIKMLAPTADVSAQAALGS